MINRNMLVKKIEEMPLNLLEQVADYVVYIETKNDRKNIFMRDDITLASEKSLSKDWLRPEEDEAWKDL